MKFGGSSLGSAARIRRCARLVEKSEKSDPVVVVSACGQTTNMLLETSKAALSKTPSAQGIVSFHRRLLEELGLEEDLLDDLFTQLRTVLKGVSLVGELTRRTCDLIVSFGERMSARVFAGVLASMGLEAQPVNSYEAGMITQEGYGEPRLGREAYGLLARNLSKRHGVSVVTGFLGADRCGNITTLGRNGSDYSATIIAAALGAKEVQIWTDVDGVMTCDPSLDDSARCLKNLSFDEAGELACFGAQVLHPNTLVPARAASIPVRVLNTNRPKDPGTLISRRPDLTGRPAKSVVYKEHLTVFTVRSFRLTSAVEILSSALKIMGESKVDLRMAATSEASLSFIASGSQEDGCISAAADSMESLGEVEVEEGKTLLCVVGEELAEDRDASGRVWGVLQEAGIEARMFLSGASRISLSAIVDDGVRDDAARALHRMIL